jgi:hypothetical protein
MLFSVDSITANVADLKGYGAKWLMDALATGFLNR